MTVAELIAELQKHAPETRLVYWAEEYGKEKWMLLEFGSGFQVVTVNKSTHEHRNLPEDGEKVLLLY